MANTFKVESFNSAKVLAFVAIGFFSIITLFNVLYVLWGIGNFIFPDWLLNGNGFMEVFTSLIEILDAFGLLIRIFAIVAFLIWLYKAFSNLSPLKARDLEFSPGWAVGWWFIPFANLIKPYQVVAELWRESDPDFDESLGFLSSHVGNPGFIGIWWACWIISNILANIVSRMSNALISSTSTDATTINVFFILIIFSSAFTIAAGGLLIYIIQSVTVRQEKRFERIGHSINEQPPPPPEFNQD